MAQSAWQLVDKISTHSVGADPESALLAIHDVQSRLVGPTHSVHVGSQIWYLANILLS